LVEVPAGLLEARRDHDEPAGRRPDRLPALPEDLPRSDRLTVDRAARVDEALRHVRRRAAEAVERDRLLRAEEVVVLDRAARQVRRRETPLLLVVGDEGGEALLLVLRREAGLEPAERLRDERVPRDETPPVIVGLEAVELRDRRRDLSAAAPVAGDGLSRGLP